jgi:class 3 adenylate cyclase/tetratricopeptide (TPR) repeat protein
MNKTERIAAPIDTSDVQLSADVADLARRLAIENHRQWAQGKRDEGWSWGPRFHKAKKQDPALLPFEKLPEKVRARRLRASMQAAKATVKLGYQVQKVRSVGPRTTVEHLEKLLAADELPLIPTFKRLYAEQDEDFWKHHRGFHDAFAKALISAGHFTAAYDYASRALQHQPRDFPLMYRQALALARGRNVHRARDVVERLLEAIESQRRPDLALHDEALSLAGRLFKDLGRASRRDPRRRRRLFRSAHERYARAYELTGNWFPLINAATTAMVSGSAAKARQLAEQVIAQAGEDLDEHGNTDDYWLLATLGEAYLIGGEVDRATEMYQRAVGLAGERIGDVASMRRNVELLAPHVRTTDALMRVFAFGSVVVFSGHMIDHPDRTTKHGLPERFPPIRLLERRLGKAIAAQLDQMNAVVGYSSVACGADILFAEAMLERGAELHVVLPFDLEDFDHTSVTFGIPQMREWRKRCDAIVARAQVHYATRERYLNDTALFDFANRIMQGLALVRAEEFGVDAHALVAYDQKGISRGKVGTEGFVKRWRRMGRDAVVVELGELRDALPPSARPRKLGPPRETTDAPANARGKRHIAYMLFSDVQNFSHVKEEDARGFIGEFMNIVARVTASSRIRPSCMNTWGDALYLVFDSPVDAADFAIRLLRRMDKVDWSKHNLSSDTAIRIGMHAGPVYRLNNPILKRQDVFGSHVNFAARIEPVTTPGSAWVSEHFAAELGVTPDHDFVCEYVGIQELPKRFGKAPLYRLDRR